MTYITAVPALDLALSRRKGRSQTFVIEHPTTIVFRKVKTSYYVSQDILLLFLISQRMWILEVREAGQVSWPNKARL